MFPGKIVIADYDPKWPELYETERQALVGLIGEFMVDIQHIGSTSVVGLGAKPIIDIMIGVKDLAAFDDGGGIEKVCTLGYDYRIEFQLDLPFRRYFSKQDAAGRRSHQIHLVEYTNEWWRDHIVFRDYLRAHPQACAAYEAHKREVAPRFTEVLDYNSAKEAFILEMRAKAYQWAEEQEGDSE